MKNLQLMLAGILVSVAGCQTGQPAHTAAIDSGNFMGLWSTYTHCQAASDSTPLHNDAVALAKAANRSLSAEAFILPLPGKIEKLIATPADRFAVDIKAMAAACSLRAGTAAIEAGNLDAAKDLLRTVLSYQPQSEYAYYTLQAKALLSDLEANILEVTLNLP